MPLIARLTPTACDCAIAIEETITTPGPGLGHGRAADCCAWALWLATTLRIVNF
jgi:hypothetical protein